MRPTLAAACMLLAATFAPGQALDAPSLPRFGIGLNGLSYWADSPFANTAFTGGGWIEFAPGQWGSNIAAHGNPQFDPATLLPRYLNPGRRLRLLMYPMHANYNNRPATWPVRSVAGHGRVLVTWRGNADVRFNSNGFVAAASNGAATGRIDNGRRAYNTGTSSSFWVEIHDIDPADPLTELRVWLPDPANPANATLEGRLFHPELLARIADFDAAFLRFMDWGSTNASPQQDWVDRRLPSHALQTGTLHPRAPATGFAGDRETGAAYEYMVALANETGRDLWICVPHLATEEYVRKLARLIRFGSDGVEPYASPQASPVWAPLRADLRVWVEYSNEIWSNGNAFPQGNWAQERANALGITKERFNARRFCEIWRLFQQEFGGADRIVRVAAIFTANSTYTQGFLNEIAAFGPTLSPAVTADVVAPTTYFGNGIQDWAFETAQARAGTADAWFLTTEMFGSRPVGVAANAPYWTGPDLQRHLDATFREWKRRIFSGSAAEGGGPDSTGMGGGFDSDLRTWIANAFGRSVPIVSYEGGPSLYTDDRDGPDARDDALTTFIEALNRAPAFGEIQRVQLNMALAKGLRTHGMFVAPWGSWGKYGQWGQLEFQGQNPATSPRWQALLAHQAERTVVRHPDDLVGTRPEFTTAPRLPTAVWSQPYTVDIATAGGDVAAGGARRVAVIGSLLVPGLEVQDLGGGALRVGGTPTATGDNFVYARVLDDDGDAAWQVFAFTAVGGPGTVIECNLTGSDPARNLPWTAAHVLRDGLATTGWVAGSGIITVAGDDALHWSQNMPGNEADSTLALAVTDNEHWSLTLTPEPGNVLNLRGAQVSFTVWRRDYHAPRRYAVFTSLTGLAAGQELFATPRSNDTGSAQHVFNLPDDPALDGVAAPVTFRIVGFSGQYGAHVTRLTAFQITDPRVAGMSRLQAWRARHGLPQDGSGTGANDADPDGDGVTNFLEYAWRGTPTVGTDGAHLAPRVVRNAGNVLEMTFARAADPALVYDVRATNAPELGEAGWTSIWSSTGAANVAGTVTVTDLVPVTAQPLRWLALWVRSQEP